MSKYTFLCCIFLGFPCYSAELNDLDSSYYSKSQSVLGGIGLIQTPTARFSNDGEFAFGISLESPYNRLYAKVQFFPWLETVLRYTEGTYLAYYPGSHQTWKDKGIDVKFRLFEEKDIVPELAFGLTDFGGTGAYSSEYIVASKRINNFDLTLGIGWGRLAGRNNISNPFGWFSDSYETRGGYAGRGGQLSLSKLFTGNTSIFGGLEYHTPIPNLSLKLEHDTSDYKEVMGQETIFDQTGDIFEVDSPFNIALNYRLNIGEKDKVDLSLGYVRGNTFYVNLAAATNLNVTDKHKYIAPPEILNQPYLQPFQSLDPDWQEYLSDLIMWQMGNEGFVTQRLIFNGNELQAEISQGRFQKPSQAIDLASRILANNSPTNIEKITVINIDQGIETLRATIPREILVNAVVNGPLDEDLLEFNINTPMDTSALVKENDYLYPHFYWEIKPHMLGTLQHQQRFYFWQMQALIHSELSIKKGLYLSTDIGINIVNNYESYTYHMPDGQLHHVRQDRRLYLTEGESGLRRMALDYLVDINPNVKAKLSAGYLEWMYGGIGGEVLYIPDHKQWALGLDAYWVKQREFDQKFSFRNYETITGFLSYYYDLPFYDMRFKINAGKFLGKDTGVHIDISRRFKTGARVGGIVAVTNCDSTCVGEGSFNKWIYFELPMDPFYTKSTSRGKLGYSWSPLTKDAGQRVEPGGLYNLLVNATDEVDSLRRKPWSVKKILSGFSTTSIKKL